MRLLFGIVLCVCAVPVGAATIIAPTFIAYHQGDAVKGVLKIDSPPAFADIVWTVTAPVAVGGNYPELSATERADQTLADLGTPAADDDRFVLSSKLSMTMQDTDGKLVPLVLPYMLKAVLKDASGATVDTLTHTLNIEVLPFDISRFTPPANTPEEADTYDSINLMAFLLDGTTTAGLFDNANTLGTMITALSADSATNPRGVPAAAEVRLITDNEREQILQILTNLQDPSTQGLRSRPLKALYTGNYNDALRKANPLAYGQMDKLRAFGFVLPFLHASDTTVNDNWFKTYIDSTSGVGAMTELDIYTKKMRYISNASAKRARLRDAKDMGVFFSKHSADGSKIVGLAEGDGTKDNSKVCGQTWNGSTWVDTCLPCSNPQRQSFCAIVDGECTLASDPGPCTLYPAAL